MGVLLPAGIILLAVTLYDIVITTLTTRGAGPFADRLMNGMWTLMCLVQRQRSGAHGVLAAAGTPIVLSVIVAWVVLLWAAWAMMFLSTPGSVVGSLDGKPADTLEVIYFTGFNLFTLGLGDFKPGPGLWKILTALCAGNGLLTLTLSATYLVPVASAAAQKRALAGLVDGLGRTPDGILLRHWNGRDFGGLESRLHDLSGRIILQSQQFLAYPALHYFHSADMRTSLPLRLVALDEALTLLEAAVPGERRPSAAAIAEARAAIDLFLRGARIGPDAPPPPPPDLERLREAGVPLLADAEAGLQGWTDRRRRLVRLLAKEHWEWKDLSSQPPNTPAAES